jgi:excinuclease ABC subunit A
LVNNRKGHYKELFETLRKKGFLHVRLDGELTEITSGMKLDRYKNHSIELVVDRLKVAAKDIRRLHDTVADASRRQTADDL